MRRLFFGGLPLCWLLLCATQPAGGALLFSDNFSYTNGPLIIASGGLWAHHSGASTGEVQVLSGRAILSQTNNEDVHAQLQGQPFGASTNIFLYAGFTLRCVTLPSGGGAYFAHFKDAGSSGFRGRIYLTTNGAPFGFFRAGLANADNTVPSVVINSNLNLNTDYLLVMRYAPSNASSTLWVSPMTESDFSLTASDVTSPLSITSFGLRESLSGGNGMGTIQLDNVVLATTFGEAANNSGPPIVITSPQSQSVVENSNVTFTVLAGGSRPLHYQWRFHGTNLAGATNSSLTLFSVNTNQGGPYSVNITNLVGSTNTSDATLTVVPGQSPPLITAEPQSRVAIEGSNVTFSVSAIGTVPLSFQWRFNGTNLTGGTNAELMLVAVTTNQAGQYSVLITNVAGSTNSQTVTLAVIPAGEALPALSYLAYNVKGNGATNWTTNAVQVRAIGRQLMHLNPDVIGFNEIPHHFIYEMTNFIPAFLPGYYLATNSGTDGFIRSVVASRYPIVASRKHLDSADLNPFGYTNSNFTRDLFEAEIAVPGFPQPFHAFVVHLKSGQGTDDSLKRAAEANAISNFFVHGFLTTNGTHPYVLSGDMNEDISDPPPSNPQTIQRLISPATGLRLTTPLNPVTGSSLTFSIQSSNGLSQRYDYILPNGLLFSNLTSSQVFRSDVLSNPPPPLLTSDSQTASDHLPVFMVFANPYTKPFRLTSISRSNQTVTLKWDSVIGQTYRLEISSNLMGWAPWAENLLATTSSYTFSTNAPSQQNFYRVRRN